MNREQKTLVVCVLTILFLAFSNFAQSGKLIFTFPINEYLFLGVSTYFAYFHWKAYKSLYVVMLIFAAAQLFSETYNLELFCTNEQLEWYNDHLIRDFLKISLQLLLTCFAYLSFKRSAIKNALSYAILLFLPAFVGLWINQIALLLLSLFGLTVCIGFLKKRQNESFASLYYLLVLLCLLNLTKSFYIGV